MPAPLLTRLYTAFKAAPVNLYPFTPVPVWDLQDKSLKNLLKTLPPALIIIWIFYNFIHSL